MAGFLADADPTSLPPWVVGGLSIPFLSGLWWIERGDRKAAEERLRQATERVYQAVDVLSRAVEALERKEQRRGSR